MQYEVRIEKNDDDIKLVLDATGNILCKNDSSSSSNDNGNNSGQVPDNIMGYINANYSGYDVDSFEKEDLCDNSVVYEVELEDGPGPDVDLYFTLSGEFLFAATEISESDLPEAVKAAIESDFSSFSIEDDKVERFEMADGSLQYEVELESDEDDVEVIFDAAGNVVCKDD